MATENLSRKKNFAEKKMICTSVFDLDFNDITIIGDTYQLAEMPADAVIMRAVLVVEEAGDALLEFDLMLDSTVIFGGFDAVTPGVQVQNPNVETGTGGVLSVVPLTAAGITQGKWKLMVEYQEYALGIAKFTNYLPAS